MNKYSVITIIAIIVIVTPFVYSGMNIYAAEQVKYKWAETKEFNFFEMLDNGTIEVCNKSPFVANFKNFQVTIFYNMENKGTFQIENMSIDGSNVQTKSGHFSSEDYVESQHLFMQMDFQFDGGDMRIDPNKMFVMVSIDTPIIGIIPYTSVTQYTGFEFDQLMNQENFEC